MGKTISEKIISRACGKSVKALDIVWVNVDMAMMDDILGPRVEIAEKMELLNKDKVFDEKKVVIISDHYTPPASIKQAEIVKFTRDFAKKKNIDNYYEFVGPCHQIMAENGHVLPGTIVLGTDSHTCMGGALGAFATGVGSTEMLGILCTGKTWLKVPETIKVTWSGKLQKGVMAKDISLKTIGTIGHSGATYKAIEYVGDTISNLSMDERMAITNMAVEMGAKVGIIPPDETTKKFLEEIGIEDDYKFFKSDDNAKYCECIDFDAEKLEPVVACPNAVDNVKKISDIGEVNINQAFLGSCTGGRYNDLKMAADLIKGHKVKKGVRFLVSPASQKIYNQALKDGILEVLAEAGATVMSPSCGLCVGVHSGLLAKDEVCISSSNRNFLGRMGSNKSKIYLASPISVAASALTGKITDPRKFL